jgi:cobalt transporter subunit CbtA
VIGRVLLATLLAGIVAGLLLGALTQVRLVPLILQAETFETDGGHTHDANAEPDEHDQAAWAPAEGGERVAFTLMTSAVAGAGFAALLTGVSFVLGLPITRRTGLFWGLCGFAGVSLAPAAGMPPELPGMPAAELGARQAWWVLTIACTATALWLFAMRREWWALVLAVMIILAPHIIGAPVPSAHETKLEAGLMQTFVANSLAVNGLFWAVLGVLLGHALERFEKDVS